MLSVNATTLVGLNLSGADLTETDLHGADLAGGRLREANLLRANLARADLSDCELTCATLAGANLEGANLEGADLGHAHLEYPDSVVQTLPPYLVSPAHGDTVRLAAVHTRDGEKVARALQAAKVPASVSGHLGWYFSVREEDHERAYGILERDARERSYPIRMFRQSLSEAGEPKLVKIEIGSFEPAREERPVTRLARASLRGANLVDAFLDGADLSGSDLRHAKLANQILHSTNLQRTSLAHADLRGVILGYHDLRGVDLQEADLRDAVLSAAYSYERRERGGGRGRGRYGTQLQGANLQGADLREAALWGADLTGANLRCVDLRHADFAGTHLSRDQWDELRQWLGADLPRTDLTGADLSGADLRGARYNSDTRWPLGFDPREHGAELVPQTNPS